MASYLELFIESTQSLPTDLYKALNLMRELDQQCQSILTELHGKEQEYLEAMEHKREPHPGLLDEIKAKQQHALSLSDEKVQLAVQTYDIVDRCIRKLDADLKHFDANLSPEEREKLNAHREGAALGAPEADMPVDPDEPVYCICQKVSFGEMVQCDSTDCRFDWFHFPCVGLTPGQGPKGKWYCPGCRGATSSELAGLPLPT